MKKVLYILSTILMLTVIIVGATIVSSASIYSGNCGPEGNESSVTWRLDTWTQVLTISGRGEMRDVELQDALPEIVNTCVQVSNLHVTLLSFPSGPQFPL